MRAVGALVALAIEAGVLAIGVGAAAPAWAQDDVTRARAFFEAGKQSYEAGRYAQAIAAFGESYALAPRSATVFSLGQAFRLQYFQDRDPGKLKRAIDLYRQYLAEEPRGARRGDATEHLAVLDPIWQRMEDKERRAASEVSARAPTQIMVSSPQAGAMGAVDGAPLTEVPFVITAAPGKHRIRVEAEGYFPAEYEQIAIDGRLVMVDAKLEPRPATVRVDAPDGAQVSLSGRPVGEAPLAPLTVPAGRYLVTVTQTGRYPEQRDITLGRGGEATLDMDLETTGQRYVAYGVWGTSAAALALGGMATAFALDQEGKAQDIRARQAGPSPLLPDDLVAYDRAVSRRDELSNVAVVLFGSSVALAITGTLLYFFDTPRVEASPPGVDVVPVIGPDGAGVSVTGSL